MTEFEFLKDAYQSLSDQERIEFAEKRKPGNDGVCNHGVAAITCIIKDFLELRMKEQL